jgi:hypothetical protein
MHNPVEPQLEYVFTITAEIERPRSAGLSPTGERLHIPIIGGTVTGPKLKGRILPGGSDWPIIGYSLKLSARNATLFTTEL